MQKNTANRRPPPVVTIHPDADFAIGERVFHQKFGYGEISDAEADKLTVDFDKAGEKRVLARFLRPADQADDVPF